MECAADVVAVEFQPKPQLTLKLPEYFLKWCPLLPKPLLVHVRFTFNRLVLTVSIKVIKKGRNGAGIVPYILYLLLMVFTSAYMCFSSVV